MPTSPAWSDHQEGAGPVPLQAVLLLPGTHVLRQLLTLSISAWML